MPVVLLLVGGCTPSTKSADVKEDPQSVTTGEDNQSGRDGLEKLSAPQPKDEVSAWGEDEDGVASSIGQVISADQVAAMFEGQAPSVWGLEVPGVVAWVSSDGVLLTLDACGGPGGDGYDAPLIEGLIERDVPAILFLNQRWIDTHPDLAADLARNPLFEIANHGTDHKPLSVDGRSAYGLAGTSSPLEAAEEVRGNHIRITELTGGAPRFFRSGTAHYDDVAVQIAQAFGEEVLGFSINADGGATLSAAAVRSRVASAKPGDVIIAHMNQPGRQTAEGLLAGIDDLMSKGTRFTLVEDLP